MKHKILWLFGMDELILSRETVKQAFYELFRLAIIALSILFILSQYPLSPLRFVYQEI